MKSSASPRPFRGTNNYFFCDGASLLADVGRLHQAKLQFKGRRLVVSKLVDQSLTAFQHLHDGVIRRSVFYFVKGSEDRVLKLVDMPDHSQANTVRDLRIEYCGERLKDVERAREWLESQGDSIPQHVHDSVYRAEKALDTQICCDALSLAGQGKLDRLFLYTNDYDFAPMLRALRQFGANVTLVRLIEERTNKDLAKESDGLWVLDDYCLDKCFTPAPASPEPP